AAESQDSSTLIFAELEWLFLQKTIIFFLKVAPLAQRFLPLSLQTARHQTILGLNRPVLPLGTLGFVAGPLQALLPVAVQLLTLLVNILDRLQTQLQSSGLEGTQDLLGHELVHYPSFESATRGAFILPPHTPIVGGRLALIAGVHAPATGPADQQARQQRPAVARHPERTASRAVLEQPLQVGLVPFPRDIGRQAIALEHQPLRHRDRARFDLAATRGCPFVIDTATSVGVGPRIDRMVQHPSEHSRSGQVPFQVAAPRSAAD